MHDDTLGLLLLTHERRVGVREGRELLAVPFPLALELLGHLLLQDERLQGVVALLLGARQTDGESSGVVLLLLDEAGQATVLALVRLDLVLELLGLLRELFGKGLELEELSRSCRSASSMHGNTFREGKRRTCCFQLSSSSTKKLFRFVTLASSVSIRPLRVMKSCHASSASREY